MAGQRCPRCAQESGRELAAARAAVEVGEIDLLACAACGGIFIASTQLALVCPTASHLPEHKGEVELTGGRGRGIEGCPGCSAAPYEINLAGVMVDFCTRCHGLWLDGSEYGEAPTLERREAAPQNPYRRSAPEVGEQRSQLPCAYCGERFAPNVLGFWEHGRLCRACLGRRQNRQAIRRAEGDWLDELVSGLTGHLFER